METILRATMEILCLLIGQENVAVKKFGNTVIIEPPPRCLKENDKQKVLELASKIIELLTVEGFLDGTTDVCMDAPRRPHQAVCDSHAHLDITRPLKPSSEHLEEAIWEMEQKSSEDITGIHGSYENGNLKDEDMEPSVQHSSICVNLKADLNMSDMCRIELPTLNIKEEPFSGDEDSFTEAVVSTSVAVNIKEESFSNEETKYSTNDLKEEPSVSAEGSQDSTPFHIIKVLSASLHKDSRKPNTSQVVQSNKDGMYCSQDGGESYPTSSCFLKRENGHKVKKIPQSGKNFSSNAALTRHQTALAEERKCGKSSPSKPALLAHQWNHKRKSHIVGPPMPGTGEKFCSIKATMVLQQRPDTGNVLYSCSKCGRGFLQETFLQQHLSIHNGEKPYACPECGKRFFQNNSLKQHLNVHLPTKKGTFCCSECGKCYKREADYKWHMLIHLGEKSAQPSIQL